eukprot:scaffold1233_cov395-Prasinococcus_capsulatus_cf.AAC.43
MESQAAELNLPGYYRQFEPEVIESLVQKLVDRLQDHVHVTHPYVDETMGLSDTLRERLKLLSPEVRIADCGPLGTARVDVGGSKSRSVCGDEQEFERVLHPVFEQDELTLIIAGGVLGAIAGGLQQVYTVATETKGASNNSGSESNGSPAMDVEVQEISGADDEAPSTPQPT